MAVINLRGTNASGKSTVVKKFIDDFGGEPIFYQVGEFKWIVTEKDKAKGTKWKEPLLCKKANHEIKGYVIRKEKSGLSQDLYIPGAYKTPTGGCDTIGTGEAARKLVFDWASQGHVLYEGLLISGLFDKYNTLADELKQVGQNHIFGFLDTPIDVCVERVFHRQAVRGVKKDFDPNKTQIPKFEAILIARRKFEAAAGPNCECCKVKPCHSNKKDVRTIPYQDAFPTVYRWFQEA